MGNVFITLELLKIFECPPAIIYLVIKPQPHTVTLRLCSQEQGQAGKSQLLGFYFPFKDGKLEIKTPVTLGNTRAAKSQPPKCHPQSSYPRFCFQGHFKHPLSCPQILKQPKPPNQHLPFITWTRKRKAAQSGCWKMKLQAARNQKSKVLIT